VGAGAEHRKAPQKTIIIQKKKKKKKSSNHRRWTPTLQGRIKQKKTTSTKPARKHEQAELHPQGPKAQTRAKQTEPTTHEPTNQQEPSSQQTTYVSPTITKLHPKHRRNQKHTRSMRLQISKHSYLQTANTEQQTRNTK
jgi:hypothetical protein